MLDDIAIALGRMGSVERTMHVTTVDEPTKQVLLIQDDAGDTWVVRASRLEMIE